MLETALVFDAADTHLCRIDDATPNLRAVLAGHVHVFHRSDLFPGVPQICAPRGFDGEALELEFLP